MITTNGFIYLNYNFVEHVSFRRRSEGPLSNTDTIIFAKHMVGNLQVPRATVFVLHPQDGFGKVAQLIKVRKVSIAGYKFVVLLFGRADLWMTLTSYKVKVTKCLTAIQEVSRDSIMVVTAVLQRVGNDQWVPGRVGPHNHYLSMLAEEAENVEFSKPGKALICSGRVSPVFFDQDGNLNPA